MTHIFELPRGPEPDRQQQALDRLVTSGVPLRWYSHLALATVDFAGAGDDDLQPFEPLRMRRLGTFRLARAARPQSADVPKSWNLDALGLGTCSCTGSGVTVGLVDSGVDDSHAALKGRVAAWSAMDMNGTKVETTIPAAPGDADRDRHGTGVASVICGAEFQGQRSVAPGAKLSVVRLDPQEQGEYSDELLVKAIEHFSEGKVRIVNVSIDEGTEEGVHEMIFKAALNAGVFTVSPIGNCGKGCAAIPGRCQSVLSCGAVAPGGALYEQSSRIPGDRPAVDPDLLVPGDKVWVASVGAKSMATLAMRSGTSFAAPHIAGLAALLLESDHDLDVSILRQRILASCAKPLDPTTAVNGIPDASRLGCCEKTTQPHTAGPNLIRTRAG